MLQQGAEPQVKAVTPTACLRGRLDGSCWLPKEERPMVNKKSMCLNLRGPVTYLLSSRKQHTMERLVMELPVRCAELWKLPCQEASLIPELSAPLHPLSNQSY